MSSVTDVVRNTRRRVLDAPLEGVNKVLESARTVSGSSPTEAVQFVRDLVAPGSHALAEPPAGSGLEPVMGDADQPILGSVNVITGDRAQWAMEKYQQYGPNWWSMIAARRFVQIGSPTGVKQVLINADKEFSSDGWVELIGKFFGGGLMLMSFDHHLDHRRIMHSAFTPQRLAGYLAGMDAQVVAELETWEDGQHLFYPTLKDLGLRIATEVFLGMDLESGHRQRILRSFHAQARAPLAKLRMDLPMTLWGAGRNGYDYIQAFFADTIEDKRANPGDDLFSAMVHAEDEDGAHFTDEEIIKHMNFLWFASHDTTNLAMTMMGWAFAAHPEWQERAREEALALGEGLLTRDDLDKLPAIDLVLREVMRLWPPVPAALRQAVVDTQIDGQYIPKDTWIQVFPVMTHRLPEFYKDPDTFDPSRFEEPREEHRAHSHAYIPFGGGVHKCIGFAFAEMEAKAVYARMLRTHKLSVPEGYEPKMRWLGLPEPADELPVTVTRL
jgi:cytochrome P450